MVCGADVLYGASTATTRVRAGCSPGSAFRAAGGSTRRLIDAGPFVGRVPPNQIHLDLFEFAGGAVPVGRGVATPHIDPTVAPAALGRAVLLGRAAATMTSAAVGLRLVANPTPLWIVLAIVVLTTAAALVAVSRNPDLVRRPVTILVLDFIVVLAVLAISEGGVAYFCCAAGASALAGVLVGMRALVPAALHTVLGYVVAASVLHTDGASPDLAAFVLTFPIANVLAAVGTAAASAALTRYVELSVEVVASAQRSAAASERARLARELHDSVAKTLRGISFAALALPSSLRRHPALAEKLASAVSRGAAAAAQEARELLDGLRLDAPDQDFAATLSDICRHWSEAFAVPVTLTASPADPSVAVRYELCRILQEALRNAAQHADATRIAVELTTAGDRLCLRVRDDGRGFPVPANLSDLRAGNHYGIIGMRERAHTAGGTLRVDSAPSRGTTVEVRVPLAIPTAARGAP
jgi:signal transduction histidine kinase